MLDYHVDGQYMDTHLDNFQRVNKADFYEDVFAGDSLGRIKDSPIVAFRRLTSLIQLLSFVPIEIVGVGDGKFSKLNDSPASAYTSQRKAEAEAEGSG